MGAQPATVIGRYEVIERLAVGGMAELFIARLAGAHGFERRVVIKKILPKLAVNDRFVTMFIDEARITSQLHHAKIVQVLELDHHDDELYIAMEYVEGVDVLELLRQGKSQSRALPPPLAAHIAHEVLDALDYAHGATGADGQPLNIVHRDVSPGNVLISKIGDVKLTDFGIARAAERHHRTQAGTLKGKYSYMSPELIAHKAIDSRSDLFSVGVLLSEMLMGTRLFAAPSELDLLLQVRDVKLDRLHKYGGGIPDGLRRILDRALTRMPADRWQTAGEFRDAVADWLYASKNRVTARDLAAYIDELLAGAVDRRGDGRVVGEVADVNTISGPVTRAGAIDAENRARLGRGLYERATPGVGVAAILPSVEAVIPRREADETGHFDRVAPMQLLFGLARSDSSGLLVVDRPDVLKAIYFERGKPTSVRSDRPGEGFGQYLVDEGVLTDSELARAIEVLPHFGGRMSDTLAGLGLMTALEAVRVLGDLAGRRLMGVCSWQDGRYRWYMGQPRPDDEVALDLDPFALLAAAAAELEGDVVRPWAQSMSQRKPRATGDASVMARFASDAIRVVHDSLDGSRTVEELAFPYIVEADQLALLRTLYLLVQCGLVRLES